MFFQIIYTIIVNLGLLVMAAQILVNIKSIATLLTKEKLNRKETIFLILIFSCLGIGATIFGTKTPEGIVNTRSVVAFASGLLFGPYVGLGTGLIAGIQRYIYMPYDLTGVACSIATVIAGLIGGYGYKQKLFPNKSVNILILMILVEAVETILVLLLSRPFDVAVLFVIDVLSIMVVLNCIGCLLFLNVFKQGILKIELYSSQRVNSAFVLADRLLPYLRKGIKDSDNLSHALSIITNEKDINFALIYNKKNECIAKATQPYQVDDFLVKEAIVELANNEKETIVRNTSKDTYLVSKLYSNNKVIAYFVLVIKKNKLMVESSIEYTNGLSNIMSTQLELAQIDINKTKVKQAEYDMLQAQINPHFLFNILNTIISVSRTNVETARMLLVDLSTYFRGILKQGNDLITLQEALDNIEVYFSLEQARFGDTIKLEINNQTDSQQLVPRFSLQPIVENAIKHGLRGKKQGLIAINIKNIQDDCYITISDNGKGMSKEQIEYMLSEDETKESIGINNVNRRLKNYFGSEYGLSVVSVLNEYTIVTIKIPLKEA